MMAPEIFVARNDKMIAIDLLNTQRHNQLIRLQNLILNNTGILDRIQLKINSFYFEEFQCDTCGSVSENAVVGGWSKFLANPVPSNWKKFFAKFGVGGPCFCVTLEEIVDALESEDPLRVALEFIPLFAARTWSHQPQDHENDGENNDTGGNY